MTGIKKVVLALATAGLLSSGAAQATLVDRGGGLFYDNVLNVTWLQDANYANTQYGRTRRCRWFDGLDYSKQLGQ
jgi:hypothetical protein